LIEKLHLFIEVISTVISMMGIVIVVWGILVAFGGFIRSKLQLHLKRPLCRDNMIRQELGSHLLLGLEFFIAADIIVSVASPSWDKVGLLAAIVGIRTVLSYFLTLEMRINDTGPDLKTNGPEDDGGI
jgi:uncharacterized membrane protein